MSGYVVRRLVALVPVLVGISLLAYALSDLAPGDPARIILQRQTGQHVPEAEVDNLRRQLGLDDPFPIRYLRWTRAAASGDLGTSLRTGEPVMHELARRSVATVQLAVPAMLLAVLVAIPLGTVSAARRNSLTDHTSRMAALLGASVPSFVLAYLLILLFAVSLRVLPVAGRGGWRHAILPALTLAIAAAAGLTRLARASLLEVLSEDYLRTAHAKGLPAARVIVRHALRNALIPIVTLMGVRLGALLGGAVIVETVFAWPGLGKHVVDSIYARDYPTIQGFVLFIGTVFVVVNLLVDVVYVAIDPQIRLAGDAEGHLGG